MYSHGLGICLTGRVRKEGIKIHGPRKTGMGWSGLSDGEVQASHKLSVVIMDYWTERQGLLQTDEQGGGVITEKQGGSDYIP